MKSKILLFGTIFLAIVGCTNSSTGEKAANVKDTVVKTDLRKTIKEDQLAMKKDPICGMVVYKFLEDTTLYKGNIYGFCGKGCKDEFLNNPDSVISAVK